MTPDSAPHDAGPPDTATRNPARSGAEHTPWPLIVAVALGVALVMWAIKPKESTLVWTRLQAHPENRRVRAVYDAAEQERPVTVAPGHYHFSAEKNNLTLTADLLVPQGINSAQQTPFTYRVTVQGDGKTETRQAQGKALIRGGVMRLMPSSSTGLLNTVDRTLLRKVTADGFIYQSAEAPESDDPNDQSVFRRLPSP